MVKEGLFPMYLQQEPGARSNSSSTNPPVLDGFERSCCIMDPGGRWGGLHGSPPPFAHGSMTRGADSLSILFNQGSFRKPDPFSTCVSGGLVEKGSLERMEMEGTLSRSRSALLVGRVPKIHCKGFLVAARVCQAAKPRSAEAQKRNKSQKPRSTEAQHRTSGAKRRNNEAS